MRKKIVWVNGTFDVLHIGHIKLFEFAKAQGEYLIVGIDSDERIKELKGSARPINKQEFRKEFLLAIKYIDEVRIFNTSEELSLMISEIVPDVAVWGEEYKDKRKIGAEWVQEIIYFEKLEGYSSTAILSACTLMDEDRYESIPPHCYDIFVNQEEYELYKLVHQDTEFLL
jgi:D-beta-D-heptose 7-phosphate kinase/D-beta-D-heptose 1-phosphate adenosyltransferase